MTRELERRILSLIETQYVLLDSNSRRISNLERFIMSQQDQTNELDADISAQKKAIASVSSLITDNDNQIASLQEKLSQVPELDISTELAALEANNASLSGLIPAVSTPINSQAATTPDTPQPLNPLPKEPTVDANNLPSDTPPVEVNPVDANANVVPLPGTPAYAAQQVAQGVSPIPQVPVPTPGIEASGNVAVGNNVGITPSGQTVATPQAHAVDAGDDLLSNTSTSTSA